MQRKGGAGCSGERWGSMKQVNSRDTCYTMALATNSGRWSKPECPGGMDFLWAEAGELRSFLPSPGLSGQSACYLCLWPDHCWAGTLLGPQSLIPVKGPVLEARPKSVPWWMQLCADQGSRSRTATSLRHILSEVQEHSGVNGGERIKGNTLWRSLDAYTMVSHALPWLFSIPGFCKYLHVPAASDGWRSLIGSSFLLQFCPNQPAYFFIYNVLPSHQCTWIFLSSCRFFLTLQRLAC